MLIFLAEDREHELVLLLKQNLPIDVHETRPINPDDEEDVANLEIVLQINGNMDARPIQSQTFKVILSFGRRRSHWVFDHGWKKTDTTHVDSYLKIAAEIREQKALL